MNNKLKIEIFDSTLRDGAQGEGISFSVQDKLNIVKALDDFGVTYIEAGNPGSNQKELQFFKELKKLTLQNSKVCAFGSTIRKGTLAKDDSNVQSLLQADTPVVAIFGKSWDLHVTSVLKISLEDNIKIVYDTVKYLKDCKKEVIFDAEHFFDGYKENAEYAVKVLETAIDAGADTLCLCDTNGGTLPSDVKEISKFVVDKFADTKIAIHCHDDIGCAVANSIAAVESGCTQVQGTFNGFGERCGNANLSIIVANLMFKYNYNCSVNISKLKSTARKIAEISNMHIINSHPYIGKSAFAHKAGMHIDGVKKLSKSFEHIDPSLVGNSRRFLLSEIAGRGTVLTKIQQFDPNITKQSEITAQITDELKNREFFGYHYEGAEASFELLVKRKMGLCKPHFRVIMYRTSNDYPAPDGEKQSTAMVKIEVNGKTEFTCDSGNGPVNALDKALRRAIEMFYPEIKKMQLQDYKVRVIESGTTTNAKVRVLIESVYEENTFTTIGVSCDIIEASFTALIDSFEYVLSKKE